jgi:hypothetical protein
MTAYSENPFEQLQFPFNPLEVNTANQFFLSELRSAEERLNTFYD